MPLVHHLSMHLNQPFPGLLITGSCVYKHRLDQFFQFVNVHLQRLSVFPHHRLDFCPFRPGACGRAPGV